MAMCIFTRTGPGPTWYVNGSAPCQSRGESGPPRFCKMGDASAYESGVVGIFAKDAAFSGATRSESGRDGTEATPGVVASPAYWKMKPTEPRCTPVSGRHGPAMYLSPLNQPSSIGSE